MKEKGAEIMITHDTDPKLVPNLYPRMGLHTITEHTALRYDTENDRLVCFLTKVHDEQMHRDVEVGWDICAACLTHVNLCMCDGGAKLPSYIIEWNGKVPAGYRRTDPVTPNYTGLDPSYRKPERDPLSGRKVRSDKGVARPRVDSTPIPASVRVILTGPCAVHTAESKRLADGTYECTVPGCMGIA